MFSWHKWLPEEHSFTSAKNKLNNHLQKIAHQACMKIILENKLGNVCKQFSLQTKATKFFLSEYIIIHCLQVKAQKCCKTVFPNSFPTKFHHAWSISMQTSISVQNISETKLLNFLHQDKTLHVKRVLDWSFSKWTSKILIDFEVWQRSLPIFKVTQLNQGDTSCEAYDCESMKLIRGNRLLFNPLAVTKFRQRSCISPLLARKQAWLCN